MDVCWSQRGDSNLRLTVYETPNFHAPAVVLVRCRSNNRPSKRFFGRHCSRLYVGVGVKIGIKPSKTRQLAAAKSYSSAHTRRSVRTDDGKLVPLEDYPENWQLATVNFNATSLPLLPAFKFIGRGALEERNPWLHHRFGNRETCLRRLRISYRKPMHQLIRRYIEKVHFAAGPKLLRSRPIVFAFLSCPEAEIEDDIRSQFKRSTGDGPKHRFN